MDVWVYLKRKKETIMHAKNVFSSATVISDASL